MPEKEQKTYMQLLDEWTEQNVLYPLGDAWMAELESAGVKLTDEFKAKLARVETEVKKAIRERVWQSYKNGQAAGPATHSGQPKEQAKSAEAGERKAYRRPFAKRTA
jgi:hypothetical protein